MLSSITDPVALIYVNLIYQMVPDQVSQMVEIGNVNVNPPGDASFLDTPFDIEECKEAVSS